MTFIKGEMRRIGVEVVSTTGEDFVIDTAQYTVSKRTTPDVVILASDATIEGHNVQTLYTASEVGQFQVDFTYTIGPERIKARIYVEVI